MALHRNGPFLTLTCCLEHTHIAAVCALTGPYRCILTCCMPVAHVQPLSHPFTALHHHWHACRYRNLRANYVRAWKDVINWQRVGDTYDVAVQGKVLDVV